MITMLDESMLADIGEASIRDMTKTPYLQLSEEQLAELDRLLNDIRAW